MTTKTTIHAQGSDKVRLEIETVRFAGKRSNFVATNITIYKIEDDGIEQCSTFEIYSDKELPITTLPTRDVKSA